ncbi:hypothetical protein F2S72_09040 [Pseudomonas syringae pv. actinidiae]|nr:hypothetical protein [Pseudomonas syringae pv. actinidiae]
MITTNNRNVRDADDVGLLFHSILRYGEANEERLDRSIVSIGYGVLLANAEKAAAEIALQHVDEGDDWDGSLWLERMDLFDIGSLAEALYSDEVDVALAVRDWLIEFT